MLLTTLLIAAFTKETVSLNDRPIIGVLAQETNSTHGHSYFYGSYVGFLEGSGARVVPVRINQDESYYIDLMSKINGVLFPGGSASLSTSGYGKAGRIIFDNAKKLNDDGEYFPLWGTCLGFELLTHLAADGPTLSQCDGENLTLPLHFAKGALVSNLYAGLSDELIQAAEKEDITQNNHHECLSVESYMKNDKVHSFFRLLSTNTDRKGLQFVSSMEGIKYPFYGVQFHPEKSGYNWDEQLAVEHTAHAVMFMQYLGNFFIGEARKSSHKFPTLEAAASAVIGNYQPVYLGLPYFYTAYYFDDGVETLIEDEWHTVTFHIPHCGYLVRMMKPIIFLLLLLTILSLLVQGRRTRKNLILVNTSKMSSDSTDSCSEVLIKDEKELGKEYK